MLLSRCYVLQVAFALMGCIPGSIGLRGTFAPQGDEQDTVKVGPQSTQAPRPKHPLLHATIERFSTVW